MISDGNLLEIKIEVEELICEREGMIAENLQRQHIGYSLVYTEGAFYEVMGRLKNLREQLISLQGG